MSAPPSRTQTPQNQYPQIPPQNPNGDDNTDVDDEVDQLDSDSDDQNSTNSDDQYTGVTGQRVPGQTVLPALKLENMIQADGVTGNMAMSKEGVYILSVATEEFVKRMAQAGQRQAYTDGRTQIAYSDMAFTTQQYQEFMFLRDTIPASISVSEALKRREAKLNEENPALAAAPPRPEEFNPSRPASSSQIKRRPPQRAEPRIVSFSGSRMEGTIIPNGTFYTDYSQNVGRIMGNGNGQEIWTTWANERFPSRANRHQQQMQTYAEPAASSSSSTLNGSSSVSASRDRTITPSGSWNGDPDAPLPLSDTRGSYQLPRPPVLRPADNWSGQHYTGPASGYIQGHTPFSHPPQSSRTIYSMQRPE